MINSVIPGILAGNSIILKPSPQTPTPAERLRNTLITAGLPVNVMQVVHLPHELVSNLATDSRLGFLSFTGSVKGGRDLAKAAALKEAEEGSVGFKGVALELGGKDPAYVREDVDVKWAAENLVDGELPLHGRPEDEQPTDKFACYLQVPCSTLVNLVAVSNASMSTPASTMPSWRSLST